MSRDLRTVITILIVLFVMGGAVLLVLFLGADHTTQRMASAEEKYKLGDVKDGIEIYAALISSRQSSKDTVIEAMYKSAEGYMLLWLETEDLSKLNIARAKFKNLTIEYPDSLYAKRSFLKLAHIHMLEGNYDIALSDLDVIISKFTDPAIISEAYNEKGEVYFSIGDYERAIWHFSRRENMNSEHAMLGRAKSYMKTGDIEKSLDIYEDFMKYNSFSAYIREVRDIYLNTAYNYAFNQYKSGNLHSGIKYFGKIIELFPQEPKVENAWYWTGECYYDRKDYGNAISSFEEVLDNRASDLKDPDALLKLGLCFFETGDYYKALKFFENILDHYPSHRLSRKAQTWREQTIREIKYQ